MSNLCPWDSGEHASIDILLAAGCWLGVAVEQYQIGFGKVSEAHQAAKLAQLVFAISHTARTCPVAARLEETVPGLSRVISDGGSVISSTLALRASHEILRTDMPKWQIKCAYALGGGIITAFLIRPYQPQARYWQKLLQAAWTCYAFSANASMAWPPMWKSRRQISKKGTLLLLGVCWSMVYTVGAIGSANASADAINRLFGTKLPCRPEKEWHFRTAWTSLMLIYHLYQFSKVVSLGLIGTRNSARVHRRERLRASSNWSIRGVLRDLRSGLSIRNRGYMAQINLWTRESTDITIRRYSPYLERFSLDKVMAKLEERLDERYKGQLADDAAYELPADENKSILRFKEA